MNLVAKEFVASRADGDGVLVLSEFAGAADELRDAVVVNPYDVEALRLAILQALTMGEAERRERMRKLRQVVLEHDVHKWANEFVENLVPPAAAFLQGPVSRVGAMMQSASTFWKAWRTGK
jgi:trehalose-6-phosphate synthase